MNYQLKPLPYPLNGFRNSRFFHSLWGLAIGIRRNRQLKLDSDSLHRIYNSVFHQ